jgi:hypothetical protein
MKPLKSISLLVVTLLSAFLFMMSSCGTKCSDPSIVFNPAETSILKAPGEEIAFDIIVTGTDENIKSITITKTIHGSTNPFLSLTNIGSKNKTISLIDSVPVNVIYGEAITYTVTAVSDCKAGNSTEKTLTVTSGPYLIGNSMRPRIYSRFSTDNLNNTAWNLINYMQSTFTNNADMDICDSCTQPNPFITSARWGSRNGSKFVKAVGFDFNSATVKSISDAYNAGIASDLVTISVNDIIIVNIKNQNKYAAVKIRDVVEDGSATSFEDFTYFWYKMAM